MKYLLMGLSAYSYGAGFWFMNADNSLTPLLIGGGLGSLLMFGAITLAVADLIGRDK